METSFEAMYVLNDKTIKRVGYKSLRKAIRLLKRMNKQCMKHNVVADYTIRLPLKEV